MPSVHTLISSIVATFMVSGVATADTFTKYGEAEGWNVYADKEKLSCLIENVDDAGNVVQMGLTPDRGVGYVGVFTKGETTIQKNDKEAVAVLIGENLYLGEATGMRGNITKGYSGGYVLSDDPQFVEDIARQYEMVVFPEKKHSFIVNLAGTLKAIEMARECNAEQLR